MVVHLKFNLQFNLSLVEVLVFPLQHLAVDVMRNSRGEYNALNILEIQAYSYRQHGEPSLPHPIGPLAISCPNIGLIE